MILVIDVGTSSLRAALMDGQGKIRHMEQREYPLLMLPHDGVEMDLAVLDRALDDALEAVGQWLRTTQAQVQAVSVTAQRSSVIPVDREGRALANALMWQDRRAAPVCDALRDKEFDLFRRCGLRLSPVFSAPKMCYLRDTSPQIYEQAYKLVGFQEYVLHHLCGAWATDETIASRTCLFDLYEKKWSEALLQTFGLDPDKLCPLILAGSIAAETTARITAMLQQSRPIPVISAGGDQQCAALGQGATEPGHLVANSGTGAYVIAIAGSPCIDREMRVSCNAAATPGQWILEGSVLSAGRTVDWFNRTFMASRDETHPFENLERELQQSTCGAHELLFCNALTGVGTPDWDTGRRAGFAGIGPDHTRADFARAVLEGVAADVARCVQILEQFMHEPFREVRCAGGLTRIRLYNQILADMLGRPVVRAQVHEATGLGAWISAAVTLGLYMSHEEAFAALRIPYEGFEPNMENHAVYRKRQKPSESQ